MTVATKKLITDGKDIRKITLVDKCTKPLNELYEYRKNSCISRTRV